jgi:hypothetical protein
LNPQDWKLTFQIQINCGSHQLLFKRWNSSEELSEIEVSLPLSITQDNWNSLPEREIDSPMKTEERREDSPNSLIIGLSLGISVLLILGIVIVVAIIRFRLLARQSNAKSDEEGFEIDAEAYDIDQEDSEFMVEDGLGRGENQFLSDDSIGFPWE